MLILNRLLNQLVLACQTLQSRIQTKFQNVVLSSFCYHIKCFDDSLYKQNPVTFTAENADDDVAQIFVDTLEQNIRD